MWKDGGLERGLQLRLVGDLVSEFLFLQDAKTWRWIAKLYVMTTL